LIAVHAASLCATVVAAQGRSGAGVVAAAAVAGASAPALPTAMRMEWQRLLGRGDDRLARAYAFETVAQVTVFVIGPLLAGVGVALAGAGATMVAAAALGVSGGLAFAVQARAAGSGRRRGEPGRDSLAPIRVPGVQTLVLVTVLFDAALGVIEVAVIAFAERRGAPAAAGVLLALFCASAAVGGVAYGARSWSARGARRRLTVLMLLSALALAPLALAGSVVALGCLLLVAGAPFAAELATLSLALDGVAPAARGAEAYSWLSSANSAGIAFGSVAAGFLVESGGTTAAFLAAAGTVVLAAALTAARRGTLDPGLSRAVRTHGIGRL
jgi:hypothetical protein